MPTRTAAVADHGAVARYACGDCSLIDLARALGVSREAARAELDRLGIAVRNPGRPTGSSALARVLTEDYLRREYLGGRRSIAQLAVELSCSRKTVRRYLAEHGIPPQVAPGATTAGAPGGGPGPFRSVLVEREIRRPAGPSGTGLSRAALWDAYVVRGGSTTAIAAANGCAASTVARDLRRNGIPLRRRGGAPAPAVRRHARRAGIRRGVMAADT